MSPTRRTDAGTKRRGTRVRTILALLPAFLMSGPTTAQASKESDARQAVADALEQLEAGKFAEALEGFRKAEVMFPDSAELAYDQAVAHYRLGDLERARESFSRALSTRDLALEQKVKFNLGNCAYAEALERLTDLQGAIDRLRLAIAHYRDALELDPGDDDARANIETAHLLIKDLLDKKKQQEQEKEKQQQDPTSQPTSQPSQDQQCDQGQDQQQDEQGERKDQNKQQAGQDGDEKKQEQQQQQGELEQANQEQRQEQAARLEPRDPRNMSREEADRLLQAVRDKERQRRDEQHRRRQVGRPPVDRDW